MKKLKLMFVIIIIILCLFGCGGNIKNVKVIDTDSDIYSNKEIQKAVDVTLKYFKKEFEGCTLIEITYIGDDKNKDYSDFAERNNLSEVIVFESSFDVDSSGGDGSLNPNSRYTKWNWILVKDSKGNWVHVDHGY